MGVFINFTSHPSALWQREQLAAAEQYGAVEDIPFPMVSAAADKAEIAAMADHYAAQILGCQPAAVLCQGEMTLTYAVVRRLQKSGLNVLAACSERVVQEKLMPNGATARNSVFRFVQFRQY